MDGVRGPQRNREGGGRNSSSGRIISIAAVTKCHKSDVKSVLGITKDNMSSIMTPTTGLHMLMTALRRSTGKFIEVRQ
jgi:hypothetical protein